MDTIGLELGSREAGHQVDVDGLLLERGGELREDLGQAVPVPQWAAAIHGWCNTDSKIWVCGAKTEQDRAEVVQHGFDSLGEGGLIVRVREEVRDAGDHADGRLGPDLGQGIFKELKLLALENLASGQRWACPRVRLGDILLHVGIPQDCEDSGLSHNDCFSC